MTSPWKDSCCVPSPHNSQLKPPQQSNPHFPSPHLPQPLFSSLRLRFNQPAMPSSIRLLRMFNHQENKQRNETTSPLDELHESDVVWSSYSSSESQPPSPLFTPSTDSQFDAGAGISAAIGDSGSPLSRSPVVQRRKTAVSPMVSASVVALPAPYTTSTLSRSAPLKVPIWPVGRGVKSMGRFDEEDEEGFQDDDDDDEGEMVPPHEMVARSHRATSFSVVEGVGRTLKGRDLSTVRNAVMQKTGFID